MDGSNTKMKQTFLAVVGAGVFSKPPYLRNTVRWRHPYHKGSMGACVPIEMRTHMIGMFPRERIGCCSCFVLIYSDPFYSSLKVRNVISIAKNTIFQISLIMVFVAIVILKASKMRIFIRVYIFFKYIRFIEFSSHICPFI